MKKNYQRPSIRIKTIVTETILAGSGISVGGNTGIGIGEGTPPTSGSSKFNGFNNDEEEQTAKAPASVWDD